MDIETILLIHNINRVILALEVLVFILAFIGWFYSHRNNQPLKKKKGRIIITILSFFVFSPLLGTIMSMPIRAALNVDVYAYGLLLQPIGGNLSVISFEILVCIIWFTNRDLKIKTGAAK